MINVLIKSLLFLLYCLVIPFCKLRAYLTRRQQCSPIGDRILLQSATEIAQRIRRREVSNTIINVTKSTSGDEASLRRSDNRRSSRMLAYISGFQFKLINFGDINTQFRACTCMRVCVCVQCEPDVKRSDVYERSAARKSSPHTWNDARR